METPAFLDDARSLGLSDRERLATVTWIAAHPAGGDIIEGTGGARKVRFAGRGKGKSGGYRVKTFFFGTDIPVFFSTSSPRTRRPIWRRKNDEY